MLVTPAGESKSSELTVDLIFEFEFLTDHQSSKDPSPTFVTSGGMHLRLIIICIKYYKIEICNIRTRIHGYPVLDGSGTWLLTWIPLKM